MEDCAEFAELCADDRRSGAELPVGAGAGNGAVRGIGRAGSGDHRTRLGGGDEGGCVGAGGVGLREAAVGAGEMGAGGAGRFDDPRSEGSGRQGDRDGGCGDYGKISGKAWGEGAGGVFVGRDGGEGAAASGCDRGSYGNWIVAAREPASDSGYGS